MKRFDFKLEPLYKLRKNIEKKKQAEVAEVSALYNKEKEGKDNCILKINDGIKIVDSIEDTSEMINMSIYLGEYMLALNSQMAIHDRKQYMIERCLK